MAEPCIIPYRLAALYRWLTPTKGRYLCDSQTLGPIQGPGQPDTDPISLMCAFCFI